MFCFSGDEDSSTTVHHIHKACDYGRAIHGANLSSNLLEEHLLPRHAYKWA